MPSRWLRLSNPWVYGIGVLILGNALLNIFPEPPAIQEAKARKWALARQRREEELQRAMETQIQEYENLKPEAFDQRGGWDDEEGGRKDLE